MHHVGRGCEQLALPGHPDGRGSQDRGPSLPDLALGDNQMDPGARGNPRTRTPDPGAAGYQDTEQTDGIDAEGRLSGGWWSIHRGG